MVEVGFLSRLALVLLALVGYSSGAVLAGWRKVVTPTLADLGVVLVLWGGALGTYGLLGRWLSILVWVVVGLVVGVVLTVLRRGRYPDGQAPVRPAVANLFHRIWEDWKVFAAAMGNFQSRVWLALFYFVVITPFGVLVQLFSDPLRLKFPGDASIWEKRVEEGAELEDGKRQF
jgi:hypothetical protein